MTKDRGIKDRDFNDKPLSARNRRGLLFEPEDEEEAEIINRHLGKWGDRTVYARPERKNDFRPSRGDEARNNRSEGYQQRGGKNDRERQANREGRMEARRDFFSGQGSTKSQDGKGPRRDYSDSRGDRRPRRDGGKPEDKRPRWK